MDCTIYYKSVEVCQADNIILYQGKFYFLDKSSDIYELRTKLNMTKVNGNKISNFDQIVTKLNQNHEKQIVRIQQGTILHHFQKLEEVSRLTNAAENNYLGIMVHWIFCKSKKQKNNKFCQFSHENIEANRMIFLDDLESYQQFIYKDLQKEQVWGCFSQQKPIWAVNTRDDDKIYIIEKGVLMLSSSPKKHVDAIRKEVKESWHERIRKCSFQLQHKNLKGKQKFLMEQQYKKFPQKKKDPENFLFIGILSSAMTGQRRQMVRATWLQWMHYYNNTNYKYFISQDEQNFVAQSEINQNNDIIFTNSKPGYQQLSYIVIEMLRYFVTQTKHQYLFKTDDDSYIHLPRLYNQLRTEYKQSEDPKILLAGFQTQPRTIISDRWVINQINYKDIHISQQIIQSRQVQYNAGCGYMLSRQITEEIVEGNDKELVPIFTAEDFTMLWQIMDLNITTINLKWNAYIQPHKGPLLSKKYDFCTRQNLFLLHKVFPMEMLKIHKKVLTCDDSMK